MALVLKRVTERIISIDIDLISYSLALEKIITLAKSRIPGYVCFANVHMTIEAYHNSEFSDQVNRSTLVLSDGMPLVKYLNWKHKYSQERIAGMDFMPEVIALAAQNNLKLFLFGSTLEVLKKIKARIEEDYKASVVGSLSPSFDKPINDPSYIQQINESGANIVFVALGCPKQEKWMADNTNSIGAILLGVGGAFPVFAGVTKRAPGIVQKMSLEWLYRLLQEPRRLFKRYFVTNTLFVYLILRGVRVK